MARMLRNLSQILDKAAAHTAANNIAPSLMLELRLAPGPSTLFAASRFHHLNTGHVELHGRPGPIERLLEIEGVGCCSLSMQVFEPSNANAPFRVAASIVPPQDQRRLVRLFEPHPFTAQGSRVKAKIREGKCSFQVSPKGQSDWRPAIPSVDVELGIPPVPVCRRITVHRDPPSNRYRGRGKVEATDASIQPQPKQSAATGGAGKYEEPPPDS